MVRKTNFLSIYVLVSEIATFKSKKKSSLWISPKMLQNNWEPDLAVCGSLFGEKQFLWISIPFYMFDQKQMFKQIQNFPRICPIEKW